MFNKKRITYYHIGMNGSAYDAGYRNGQHLKWIPGYVAQFGGKKEKPAKRAVSELKSWFKEFNPTVLEEMQGTADAWKVNADGLLYFHESWLIPAGCTQLAAKKGTGAIIGRNYDLSDKLHDKCLTTTRLDGTYTNIGFNLLNFGRTDGINEKGLAVSMSAAGRPIGYGDWMRKPQIEGLQFWTIIRALLDNCANVKEAETVLKKVPKGCSVNMFLADSAGNITLAKVMPGNVEFVEVGEKGMCAANHFDDDPNPLPNSITRLQTASESVSGDVSAMKKYLGTPFPAGACTYDYKNCFGTLHSAVYDTETTTAHISFGAASNQQWHAFDLTPVEKPAKYKTVNPTVVYDSDFWGDEK